VISPFLLKKDAEASAQKGGKLMSYEEALQAAQIRK
jgi:hypothetical protein